MTSATDVAGSLSRLRTTSLLVGVVASIAAAAGAFLQPREFYPAYLIAFLFWWSIALGSLAISMLHHLTGGGWGAAVRRTLEASYGTLPLLAVMFIPILFGLPILFEWANPDIVAADPRLQAKAAYLNEAAFAWRAAGYFAIWIAYAFVSNRLSTRAGTTSPISATNWLVGISGPGVVLWVLSVTFASVDWTMSLDPHWLSSVHGLIFVTGQMISALTFALIIVIHFRRVPGIDREVNESRFHDLGNLLLAFTMFWTYASFVQFLVIWSGNLPEEAQWYIRRRHGAWQYVALLLIVLHFAVPFLLLLSRPLKKHTRSLVGISWLLLCMRLVEFDWHVMPNFASSALSINWLMISTPIALGGLWLAAFAWGLGTRLAIPLYQAVPEEAHHDHAH